MAGCNCVNVFFAVAFLNFLTYGFVSHSIPYKGNRVLRMKSYFPIMNCENNTVKAIHYTTPAPPTTVMPWTLIPRGGISFGKRVDGDKRIYVFDYLKPRRMLKPIAYIKATFPRANYSSNPGNCPITYIDVGCPDITCYFELGDDYVSILAGGIGKPNVLIRVSSLNRYIYFYRIQIYVKC